MRKIAVLAYPVKHRKTYDVLSLLKANGYTDVNVYAIPFHYQKKKQPLIQHRPEMNFHVPEVSTLCYAPIWGIGMKSVNWIVFTLTRNGLS